MAEFAVGLIFFSVIQLANTAPAFHFPLLIELIVLATGSFILLAALKTGKPQESNRLLNRILVFLSALIFLQIIRTIAGVTQLPEEPLCRLMPGLIQKLECIAQMEASAVPGPRQLSYTIAAGTIFAATLVLSRHASRAARNFLNGGLAIASTIAVITLLKYYKFIDFVLPNWFFVNEFGTACLFMQNPSWIWPWCTPWVAYAGWQFISLEKCNWQRLYFFSAAVLLVLYSISSSQRGAVLQLLVAGAAALIANLFWGRWKQKVSKKTFMGLTTTGAIFACAAVSTFFLAPSAINKILATIGIHTRVGGGESSLSHERLEMWRIAWAGIKDAFWLGHGQGSWTREFGKIAQTAERPNLVFDTAHNFFVQSIFELGFLHFLIIFGFFALILFLIWKKISLSNNGTKKTWVLAICSAYAVILAVQEVDFVRSSFYQHAAFWGFIVGQSVDHSVLNSPTSEASKSNRTPILVNFLIKSAAITVMVGSLLLAAVSLLGFSLAGYQYEANARQGYVPRVRWLGSFGTLNYILPRANERFPIARFKVLKSYASEYSILTNAGWKPLQIDNPEERPSFIDIPVSATFQLPMLVKFNNSRNDFGRSISVLVEWPPQIIEGEKQ